MLMLLTEGVVVSKVVAVGCQASVDAVDIGTASSFCEWEKQTKNGWALGGREWQVGEGELLKTLGADAQGRRR